jgi:hypothetical protein
MIDPDWILLALMLLWVLLILWQIVKEPDEFD